MDSSLKNKGRKLRTEISKKPRVRPVKKIAGVSCRCGLLSNAELNVGARKILLKRIRIIDGWMKSDVKDKVDHVEPNELENMWKELPYNQKHIYYSQVLEQYHRSTRISFLPSKEESQQLHTSNALLEMLMDLDRNVSDRVSKCRCILGARFTEPSINFYIEGNTPRPIQPTPVKECLTVRLEAKPKSPVLVAKAKPPIPIPRRSTRKMSGKTEAPKITSPPRPSRFRTTKESGKGTDNSNMMKSPLPSPLLPSKALRAFESRKRRSALETETFLGNLLDCTVTCLPAADKSINLSSIRSLAKTVPQSKLKNRTQVITSSPGVPIIPSSYTWTLASNPGIPDEVAYYALSIVEVIYASEEETQSKQEPVKKKRKKSTRRN